MKDKWEKCKEKYWFKEWTEYTPPWTGGWSTFISCREQTLIMRLVFTIIIINIITKLWLFSLLRSEPALTPWLCLSWLQTIHQQEKLGMKIVWLGFNRLMASSWPCFLSMMHILTHPPWGPGAVEQTVEWLHKAERILRILANQQTFEGRHEDGGRTLQLCTVINYLQRKYSLIVVNTPL